MKKWLITLVFVLLMSGCVRSVDKQGRTTHKADPCTVKKIEQGTEGAISLLGILSVFWPALIPVATGAAGAYATYKKVKPNLDIARTEANLFHTSTHTLVQAIEAIKKDQPELWAKIEPFMESRIGTNTENVIRAIRGLPAKE